MKNGLFRWKTRRDNMVVYWVVNRDIGPDDRDFMVARVMEGGAPDEEAVWSELEAAAVKGEEEQPQGRDALLIDQASA